MYKTLLIACFITVLSLSGVAQPMPVPPIEEIRADMKNVHTDTGRADRMLNIALSYIFRTGEYKSDLDSAMLWLKQAESLNRQLQDKRIKAKTFFAYSNFLRETGNPIAAHEAIEKSIGLCRTIDAPSDMGEALLDETNYFSGDDKEMIRKKRANFVAALTLFKRAGNKLREADALKNIGDFDNVLDEDRRLSMKECKEALDIYLSIGYQRMYGVYIILVDLCHKEGDYPNMVRYSELAVKYAERMGETSLQMSRIYNEAGLGYFMIGNYDTAVTFYKKAIELAKRNGAMDYFIPMTRNLCTSLVALGKTQEATHQIKEVEKFIRSRNDPLPDELQAQLLSTRLIAYTAARQYDNASFYAKEFVRLLSKYRSTDRIYLYIGALVEYFISTHQNKEGKKYADSLLGYGYIENIKQGLAYCYHLISTADSAFGDLRGALTYYQLYKKETDSLFTEASSFQLAQFQVEFETEKKDNAINVLQQQDELQKSRLERSRTTNTIVIIGVIVLALLLALLYNRYRIKQRLNHQLQQKQQAINEKNTALERLVTEKDTLISEKDWLVKEIHHRVKNNLQIVISLLNAQTEFLDNPSARSAIQQSRERMEAIAIVHQKLYQTEDNTLIHVCTYIYELVENLQDSFANARNIHFRLNISDIVLDISQSVPLGLILNEAITNAIKYAYREGEYGTVSISLQRTFGERVELKIADNGKGLTPGLDYKNTASLGLQLINLLAQQLNGELFFLNKNGLEIVLIFKPTWYTPSATTSLTSLSLSS